MFGFKKKQDPVDASIAARVEAGARLMDSRQPGWENGIDVDRLDLASNYKCVLGQTYGSFTMGAYRVFGIFGGANDGSARHGFNTTGTSASQAEVDREFYLLTKAWRVEIAERRKHKASV